MWKWLLLLAIVTPLSAKKAKWECSTAGAIETCILYIDPTGISVSAKDVRASNIQLQANWCWLASIEMSFRYYGYLVPQEKLLDLLWGKIEDMPGRPEQILGATNRVYTDENGKRFRAESVMLNNWLEVSNALALDVPVLVGYAQAGATGHMTMIVGVQMQALYNQFGQIIDTRVSGVVLWDPWPGNGLREMTQSEFNGTFLLVAVGATALDPVSVRRSFSIAKRPQSPVYFNILGRRLQNQTAFPGGSIPIRGFLP